jgi:hypothetical protein
MTTPIVVNNVVEYFQWIMRVTNILVIGAVILSILAVAAGLFGIIHWAF